jgi:hypothetical protein
MQRNRFARAIQAVNDVAEHAQASGKLRGETWRQLAVADHVAHSLRHIDSLQWGDRNEGHLIYAAWRLLMAVEVQIERTKKKKSATSAMR